MIGQTDFIGMTPIDCYTGEGDMRSRVPASVANEYLRLVDQPIEKIHLFGYGRGPSVACGRAVRRAGRGVDGRPWNIPFVAARV